MRLLAALLLSSLGISSVGMTARLHAQPAPSTLDTVRQAGVLRCGSAIRPGLAFPGADHAWSGLLVDLCRAVAVAAMGPDARTEFNGYALQQDFDRARGTDDLAFLTGSELFANSLFAAVQPGPTVFVQTMHVMVWDNAAIQDVSQLGGVMVCAEPGTAAERSLLAYARTHAIDLRFSGWQELEEMMDAFNVGRCPAVAGELTALAALRLESARLGHPSRILPQPLTATPVLAITPRRDPAWSALVAWTLQTVLAGASTLPIDGAMVGLDHGWQDRVATRGSYADLLARNLGADSVLDVPAGVNAAWDQGGLLTPATVE